MNRRSAFMDLSLFRSKRNAPRNLASFISKRAHANRRKNGSSFDQRFRKNHPKNASESKPSSKLITLKRISNKPDTAVASSHDEAGQEQQPQAEHVRSDLQRIEAGIPLRNFEVNEESTTHIDSVEDTVDFPSPEPLTNVLRHSAPAKDLCSAGTVADISKPDKTPRLRVSRGTIFGRY
ncbi:hypothetical protein BWQ96_03457 [Gracilariopsis chorda]|uniref:Uncharacterized protein n=1 Tax=Gracilariopsis chorda TaxID=448386 RepID=A0A2V3IX84_9FLOR|nr:hypothetical protein BWQ96_03457 [Gracilariopsis chorda]|eukprot:PXF46766.1 hypothetical protein BWQ96_03457 [Gracilariopsis chorda]